MTLSPETRAPYARPLETTTGLSAAEQNRVYRRLLTKYLAFFNVTK